jgi:hypothetical protein
MPDISLDRTGDAGRNWQRGFMLGMHWGRGVDQPSSAFIRGIRVKNRCQPLSGITTELLNGLRCIKKWKPVPLLPTRHPSPWALLSQPESLPSGFPGQPLAIGDFNPDGYIDLFSATANAMLRGGA